MANANDFSFDEYNKVMKTAGAGLKLFLALQLMQDIEQTCVRFRNPLTKDVSDITDELISLRKDWKSLAKKRENISEVAAQVDGEAAGQARQQHGDVPLATA